MASESLKGSEELTISAKSITDQERLVDCDGRLRTFPYGNRNKEDAARHVASNIHAGNAAFFRIGINDDAAFCTAFAAERYPIRTIELDGRVGIARCTAKIRNPGTVL